MRRRDFEVLVVGAGPAGLAAATAAAESGARTGLVDDNPAVGGQIWRAGVGGPAAEAQVWRRRLETAGVAMLTGTRAIAAPAPGILLAETPAETLELRWRRLILAPGARERFLPFPGWTLPGVAGAGGLQALVKGGLPVADQRVVVVGSGPLLLAVAAYLRDHGARVLLVAEQAPWRRLAGFGLHLLAAGKAGQASSLGWHLRGVPYRASTWVTRALGADRLAAVVLRTPGGPGTLACDYLACGFGLVPNVELPLALGCALAGDAVAVDRRQQTSVPGVYCAGEATGIGGVDLALAEGWIAGLAAAGQPEQAAAHFAARRRARRFAAALARAFALRAELKRLPEAETLVCRCEDVPYSKLRAQPGWRAAKLHTRCGMGPCQGRVCGASTAFLFGWTPDSPRPPVVPTRLESLVWSGAGAQEEVL